jgi:guanylate kinase
VPDTVKISTATTRKPRPDEVEVRDHYFISKGDFQKKIKTGEIAEYNIYDGNYYGTLRRPLEEALESGKKVLMELEVNGAAAVKKAFPGAITIFINAESMEVLEQRLRGRGTQSESSIAERLNTAQKEIEAAQKEYDYIVVNPEGHPEIAVAAIGSFLKA